MNSSEREGELTTKNSMRICFLEQTPQILTQINIINSIEIMSININNEINKIVVMHVVHFYCIRYQYDIKNVKPSKKGRLQEQHYNAHLLRQVQDGHSPATDWYNLG